MNRWSSGIRLWVLSLILLALLLGAKSFYWDSWKPEGEAERQWLKRAEAMLSEESPSLLAENSIISRRIVDIRLVKDGDGEPTGEIRVTLRSYVLGYLPFGDRYMTGELADR